MKYMRHTNRGYVVLFLGLAALNATMTPIVGMIFWRFFFGVIVIPLVAIVPEHATVAVHVPRRSRKV